MHLTGWHPEPFGLWPELNPGDQLPSSLAAEWAGQKASPEGPLYEQWRSLQESPGTCWKPKTQNTLSILIYQHYIN